MFTMLSVYAVTMNLSVFEISILLFSVTLAGALFQWPIGSLSDNYDRRIVIIGCCIFHLFLLFFQLWHQEFLLNNLFVKKCLDLIIFQQKQVWIKQNYLFL